MYIITIVSGNEFYLGSQLINPNLPETTSIKIVVNKTLEVSNLVQWFILIAVIGGFHLIKLL